VKTVELEIDALELLEEEVHLTGGCYTSCYLGSMLVMY
jgi:hypothetical protein